MVTLDTSEGELDLLLQGPRDVDMVADSQFLSFFSFSIDRQARILAVLQGTAVRVPRDYGYRPSPRPSSWSASPACRSSPS
jgi:hypothetical protein